MCCISCCFPCVFLGQLTERVGTMKGGTVFSLVLLFQACAIFFFFLDDLMIAEMLVLFFMAMNCKDVTFSNISGIPTGLPDIMTKIHPHLDDAAEVAFSKGTLFPCPNDRNFGKGVTDDINDSVDLALALAIAAVACQITVLVLVVFNLLQVRAKLRSQGKASSSCPVDFILSLFCPCCIMALTMKEAGVEARTYSFASPTGEAGGSYTSTKTDEIVSAA